MKDRKTPKDNAIVVVGEYLNDFDATLALNLLREAGINCELEGSVWPGVNGVGMPGGYVRLIVFGRDARRASEILKRSE